MFSFAKKLVDRLDTSSQRADGNRESYFKNALEINNKGYGLRVLNVKPHSLAHQHGFESWFDYIIRINNHELPMLHLGYSSFAYSINEDGSLNYGGQGAQEQAGQINVDLLKKELEAIAKNDKQLIFDVWSAKGGIIRQIIVPLTDFQPGEYDESFDNLFLNNFCELGLAVQSQHLNTATYVWRILATHQSSPSFQSRLVPYSDYIIGCDSAYPDDVEGKGLLTKGGESLLSRTVLGYYNHHYAITQEDNVPITLYVYNHDYDILRPVTVNLSRSWNRGQGRGILGCDVGYGLLHRIPEVIGKFNGNAIVDDVVFESNPNAEHLYEPSSFSPPSDTSNPMASNNTTAPPPPTAFNPMANSLPKNSPTSAPARSTRKKKAANPNSYQGLDDYMNEELLKSKEMDTFVYSDDGSTPPPPPPPSKLQN